jgi:hypothetical protein
VFQRRKAVIEEQRVVQHAFMAIAAEQEANLETVLRPYVYR